MKQIKDVEPGGKGKEQEKAGKHFDTGQAASGGGGN